MLPKVKLVGELPLAQHERFALIGSHMARELPTRARRDSLGPLVRAVIATARTFNAHHHVPSVRREGSSGYVAVRRPAPSQRPDRPERS
ncbi:MAG TPA: hypothetical protein VGI50_15895 [Solirubrobacteraceae bacterium]|jgi:hypothetical protein